MIKKLYERLLSGETIAAQNEETGEKFVLQHATTEDGQHIMIVEGRGWYCGNMPMTRKTCRWNIQEI